AVETVSRFLGSRPERAVRACKREYDEVALRSDLRIFLNVLGEADEEFRVRFMELAQSFLAQADRSALEALPAMMRLKWHLVGRGLVPELLEVLAYERRGLRIPVTRRLWRYYAKYPFWGDRRLRVPRRVFRLGEELAARARLHEMTWRRGKLHITGHAYIDYVGTGSPWSSLKAIGVREVGSGRTRAVPARTRRCRDADETAGDPHRSHRWSGFSATIDPKRLRRGGRYVDGTWLVAAGVYDRGVLRRGALSAPSSGSGAHPAWHYVDEDVRVVPMITRGGTMRLRVETVRARVTGHRVVDGALEIRGTIPGGVPDGAAVIVRRRAGTELSRYPVTSDDTAPRGYRVRIPLRELIAGASAAGEETARPPGAGQGPDPDDDVGLRLAMRLPDDPAGAAEPVQMVLDDDAAEGLYTFAGREFVVYRSRHGYAWLQVRTSRPVVTAATWESSGTLVLSGDCPSDLVDPAELVLRSRDRNEERAFPMSRAAGRFRAELPLSRVDSPGGVLPLAAGRWDLRLRQPGGTSSRSVVLDHAVLGCLPVETTVDGRRYVFREQGYDVPIVEVHSDLRPGERGAYRQARTRVRHYRAPRRLRSLRPAVVYDSYSGKQYSDSPRAIHEELVERGVELEHLWVVRDGQVELPETARPVRLWGAEWYEAMASSRYVVTNAHLPEWFVRRPGQVVVQTWHGTPL
ncbi:CDP-glycerol glycerophosphotransferase family protein, partial [Actinomadura bangladeshensis]